MVNMKAMAAARGSGLAEYNWREAVAPYIELAERISDEVRQEDLAVYTNEVQGLMVALDAVGERQYLEMVARLADPDVDDGIFSRTTENLAIIWRKIGQNEWADAVDRIIDARETLQDDRGLAIEVDQRLADFRAHLGVEYRRDTSKELAALLGIDPKAHPRLEDLQNLLSGKAANGQTIPGKKQSATLGSLELVFSADKSVSSVYALANPAERQAIVDAQRAAVDRAMHQVVAKIGFKRNRREGLDRRDPADVTWVQWQHRMSRRADPQLHTHVSLINVVRSRVDGDVGTLDTFLLHGFYHKVRETYHRALADELGKLSMPVEFDAKVPAAVLTNVPAPVLRHFSGRTADAEKAAAQWLKENRGINFDSLTPKQRSAWLGRAASKTRAPSGMYYVPGNGHAAWHARAAGQGYVPPPQFIDPKLLKNIGVVHATVRQRLTGEGPNRELNRTSPQRPPRHNRKTGRYDEGVRWGRRL